MLENLSDVYAEENSEWRLLCSHTSMLACLPVRLSFGIWVLRNCACAWTNERFGSCLMDKVIPQ